MVTQRKHSKNVNNQPRHTLTDEDEPWRYRVAVFHKFFSRFNKFWLMTDMLVKSIWGSGGGEGNVATAAVAAAADNEDDDEEE